MTEEQRDALFDALLDSQRTSSHCHTGAWCARRVMRRRAFYVLAANTGLRWAEIGRLRWGDIDVDAARVIVPAGQTKNGKQADLPLVGPVVDALRAMRPEDVGDGDRVFSGVEARPTACRHHRREG